MEFIKDYKFVIAFENSSYPGYITEKILEPLVAGCIPVYWGSPVVAKDFNEACFLNTASFDGYDALIKKIIEIDGNDGLGISMIAQNKVARGAKGHLIVLDEVCSFLVNIIQQKKSNPVAMDKMRRVIIAVKLLIIKMQEKLFRLK